MDLYREVEYDTTKVRSVVNYENDHLKFVCIRIKIFGTKT